MVFIQCVEHEHGHKRLEEIRYALFSLIFNTGKIRSKHLKGYVHYFEPRGLFTDCLADARMALAFICYDRTMEVNNNKHFQKVKSRVY